MTTDEAIEYVLDAAFIAGSMDSERVYDHHDASDYLAWAAARFAESILGVECYP